MANSADNAIHVLHVDDDRSMLHISKLMINSLNSSFIIESALDVDEALKKLSQQKFDLIISDYEMPNKNGLDFLKEIREIKNDIPFILFTGKGREEVVIQALNLGADHYVNKQGEPQTVYGELAHLAKTAVEKHQAKLKNKRDSIALHNVNEAIVSSDENFTITAWNTAAEQLFGYSAEEVLNQNLFDVLKKIHVNPPMTELMPQLHSKGRCFGEIVFQNKNGQLRNGQLIAGTITSENGQFKGTVAVCSDITDFVKTQQDAKHSQEELETILTNCPVGIAATNSNYRIVKANQAFCKITGYSEDELKNMTFKDFTHPDDVNESISHMKTLSSGAVSSMVLERRHIRKDGKIRDGKVTVGSVRDKDGKPTFFIAELEDITETKEAKRSFEASEERHRIISSLIADVAFSCTRSASGNFIIDWLIGDTENIFGCPIDDILEAGCFRFLVDQQDLPLFDEKITGLKPGDSSTFELRIRSKKGSMHWIEVDARVEEDTKKQNTHRLFGACKNITERKKAEEELKQTVAELKLIFDSVNDGYWEWDMVSGKASCSPSYFTMLGYRPDEFSSDFATMSNSIMHPESAKLVQETVEKCGRTKEPFEIEIKIKNKSGGYSWVLSRGKIVEWNSKGHPVKMVGTHTDITERKKAEEALRDSEVKYRSVVSALTEGIILFDKNGTIIATNESVHKILLLSQAELIGKNISEPILCAVDKDEIFIPQEEFPVLETIRSGKSQQDLLIGLCRKDYSFIWLSVNIEPIVTPLEKNLTSVIMTFTEITERKNSEDRLKESEEKYRSILAAMSEAVIVYDRNEKIVSINKAAERMFGFSKNQMVGKSGINPNWKAIDENNQPIADGMRPVAITLRTGKEQHAYVLGLQNPEGTFVWLSINSEPIFDDLNTKPVAVVATITDISDRKKAEEEYAKSQKQLQIINQKLQVVGSLTRHDIRNKHSIITTNTYLLRKGIKDPELLDLLEEIKGAVNDSEKMFEFSKFYEKIGAEQPSIVDVAEQFEESTRLRPHSNIEITNQVKGISVLADSMLKQLFYNLIDNSIKHGKTVNKIKLSAQQSENQIVLTYEDNGAGIPKENKEKIFFGGFTTGGTGLGLKLVKRMIEVYGWTITEEGEPGEGAKFVIKIPNNKAHEN